MRSLIFSAAASLAAAAACLADRRSMAGVDRRELNVVDGMIVLYVFMTCVLLTSCTVDGSALRLSGRTPTRGPAPGDALPALLADRPPVPADLVLDASSDTYPDLPPGADGQVDGQVALAEVAPVDQGAADLSEQVDADRDSRADASADAAPDAREVGQEIGSEVRSEVAREAASDRLPDRSTPDALSPDGGRDSPSCPAACYVGCGVGCGPGGTCVGCATCTCDTVTGTCHC